MIGRDGSCWRGTYRPGLPGRLTSRKHQLQHLALPNAQLDMAILQRGYSFYRRYDLCKGHPSANSGRFWSEPWQSI